MGGSPEIKQNNIRSLPAYIRSLDIKMRLKIGRDCFTVNTAAVTLLIPQNERISWLTVQLLIFQVTLCSAAGWCGAGEW
jgi:hypothetical protein